MTYNNKDFNKVTFGTPTNVEVDKELKITDEVIMVECEDKDKKIIFRHLHKQIIPKDKNIHGVPFQKRREFFYNQ